MQDLTSELYAWSSENNKKILNHFFYLLEDS